MQQAVFFKAVIRSADRVLAEFVPLGFIPSLHLLNDLFYWEMTFVMSKQMNRRQKLQPVWTFVPLNKLAQPINYIVGFQVSVVQILTGHGTPTGRHM